MKVNTFKERINIFPAHWQTEIRKVELHITPYMPASVKSGGVSSWIEYILADVKSMEISTASFETGNSCDNKESIL
jgi:hypothetical protein